MNVSLTTVGVVLGGSILLWAAMKGQSVGETVRALIGGKSPTVDQAYPLSSDSADESAPESFNFPAGSAGNKSLGRALATPYGWAVGAQWDALETLWDHESGWNNKAKNPSSGAYGIPQALPESKLPPAGRESGGSSATAQIQWGLAYIKNRYGNPVNAWAFWQQHHWY